MGALMMDVAAAFPSVARGCLLRKMRSMELDENLVEWVDSFMKGRKVVMSVDGQEGEAKEVATGLPQGSPVSLVLFALYMADIHKEVEGRMEEHQGTAGGQASRGAEGFQGSGGFLLWMIRGKWRGRACWIWC